MYQTPTGIQCVKLLQYFSALCHGADKLKQPLFDLSDLAVVKQSGGLNNDWDLTHRVLTLLMSKVPSAENDFNRKSLGYFTACVLS